MARSFGQRQAESFLGDLAHPEETQARLLLERIITPNRDCAYGRRHGFAGIRNPSDFQLSLPIVGYEDIRKEVDRIAEGEDGVLCSEPVRRFFMTSATTGEAKRVPVTNSLIRAKSRAFSIYWHLLFADHPRAAGGRVVTNLGDSGGGETREGPLPQSSESAFWSAWTARTQRTRTSPVPAAVSALANADDRYYAIARILLEVEPSLLMALNPSTIALLLAKLGEFSQALIGDVAAGGIRPERCPNESLRTLLDGRYKANPRRAAELRALPGAGDLLLPAFQVWPELELLACWQSPMVQPYLAMMAPHLTGIAQRDYISMASEGILTIPVESGSSGGALAIGTHFYEFLPEDQPGDRPLLAHQLREGQSYRVLISTSAGLYRYDIGDVMRVRGYFEQTPVLEFLHRSGSTSSLTGEKLTEAQVVSVVIALAEQHGLEIADFTVLPRILPFPHYVLLIEMRAGLSESFAAEFDRRLGQQNIEYRAKRDSQRLGMPEIWRVAPGSYAAWRGQRQAQGANQSQIKAPKLTRDPEFAAGFEVWDRV